MKPPFPSLTAEWHNDTYDAISPTNPTVSAKGKTVVITGGGVGIGRETAKAYAEAGAAHVAILGRTQKTLDETKSIINQQSPDTKVTTHLADVADEEAVGRAAKDLKGWEILILNAGIMANPAPIAETTLADWWRVYEVCHSFLIACSGAGYSPSQLVTISCGCLRMSPTSPISHICRAPLTPASKTNVRGAVTCVQAFLPTRNASSPASASIIGINADMVQIPAGIGPAVGTSAYTSSKMAQLKLMEFVAAENPDVFVASVHPGVVETSMVETMEKVGGVLHLDNGEWPSFCSTPQRLAWVADRRTGVSHRRFMY